MAVTSEESNADRSLGLKDVLEEPEEVNRHSQTRTETITSVDYNLLTREIEVSYVHSIIIESQTSNSSSGTTAFTYMAGTHEKIAKQFEEHALV